jgi:NADPH-dependent curcumin reductase CurA
MNLIAQRGKIEGFVVSVTFLYFANEILILACSFDYASQYPTAIKEIAAALADGSIQRKFHIVEGLEKAPEALPLLYNGGNTGKL